MMNKILNPKFAFVTIAILIAGLTRLLPHPPNFTAIGAMALFGGAMMTNKKLAFIVPMLAMFVTDLIIGFHDMMAFIYLAFALITLIGISLRNNVNVKNLLFAVLGSSAIFFLISNFAVWLGSVHYPQNFAGLMACYAAAIPFYSQDIFGSFLFNTVLGDAFFTTVLFGSYYLAQLKFPALSKVKA